MRAKLFDLSDTLQVLVTQCQNEEENVPAIEYQFMDSKGIKESIIVAYSEEGRRDKIFNKIEKSDILLMAENYSLFSWCCFEPEPKNYIEVKLKGFKVQKEPQIFDTGDIVLINKTTVGIVLNSYMGNSGPIHRIAMEVSLDSFITNPKIDWGEKQERLLFSAQVLYVEEIKGSQNIKLLIKR